MAVVTPKQNPLPLSISICNAYDHLGVVGVVGNHQHAGLGAGPLEARGHRGDTQTGRGSRGDGTAAERELQTGGKHLYVAYLEGCTAVVGNDDVAPFLLFAVKGA